MIEHCVNTNPDLRRNATNTVVLAEQTATGVITQTGCLSDFGETMGDFGVRDVRIGSPWRVSVLLATTPAENVDQRKLLRRLGILMPICDGSPAAHEKTPGSKLIRHRGLSGGGRI